MPKCFEAAKAVAGQSASLGILLQDFQPNIQRWRKEKRGLESGVACKVSALAGHHRFEYAPPPEIP